MRKLTQKEFIAKARKVHGNRFGYNAVKYVNMLVKVQILCRKHGLFWQHPNHHLLGDGCSVCSRCKRLDTQEIVARFVKAHGDRYGYELVQYVNLRTKVQIVCRVHGVFLQLPQEHSVMRRGCPWCSRSLNTPKMVAKFIAAHGDKYDYSKTVYKGHKEKVTIICRKHGAFEMLPYNFITGVGCRFCGRFSTQNTIERFVAVHGNRYNYSKVDYKGSKVKVTILCRKHGAFQQDIGAHLRGYGCRKCGTCHQRASLVRTLAEKKARRHSG